MADQKKIEEQIKQLQAQLESLQNGSTDESKTETQQNVHLDDKIEKKESDQILIVVANRLPVSMQQKDNKWTFKPSAGGLVTALKQLGDLDMQWVGCPGFIEQSEREYIATKLDTFNVHPVFVEKRDYDNYYNGFCNGILWPLFHYIELNDELVVPYFHKFYTSYRRINLLFAKAIDTLINKLQSNGKNKKILIWIHDYHLMLCPNYIRRMRRDAMIGFFLHIPFPTWEQFRILPRANDLLQGVLACNLIGFHIHDYSQHFRGACAHILQCELAPESIIYHGRMTIVSTHPIGTDINKWRDGLQQQCIKDLIIKYKAVHRDKQILLGVDRLDFIKGIPHKLYAFAKFLEDNPDLRERVVLIQIAVPSRQSAPEYIKLTKKCNELVGKINSKYSSFSSVPIHFLYQSFGFNDLVALYNISSVCYVTSLRDGMNLVSYEYVSCQHMADPGVLIVSEFAGSAQSLGCGSIVVNPWNIENVASALQTALAMDLKQRQTHQEILYKIISKNTVQHWANQFIKTLQISYAKCPRNAPIVPSPCNIYSIQRCFNLHGGLNRVIILGLGGTLIPSISNRVKLTEYSAMKKVSARLKEAINKLSAASMNCTIAILSSLPRKSLDRLLENVACIQYAENGYFQRDLRTNSPNKKWQISTNYTDNSWKDEVLKIMKYFRERTPNTTLDDNLSSFVQFRYKVNRSMFSHQISGGDMHNSDNSDNGNLRNNISQLLTSLNTGPLQSSYARLVHDSSTGHIQVRQPGVSKLSSITRLIERLASTQSAPIDSILCIANFLSFDEEIFVYLNGLQRETDNCLSSTDEESAELSKMYPSTNKNKIKYNSKLSSKRESVSLLSSNCSVETIKVGRYATRAKHYIADNKKVEDILWRLSQTVIADNSASPPSEKSFNRNWSVGSDLSTLNLINYDAPPPPPTTIPPTAAAAFINLNNDNSNGSSEYGSFDASDDENEETKETTKNNNNETIDID